MPIYPVLATDLSGNSRDMTYVATNPDLNFGQPGPLGATSVAIEVLNPPDRHFAWAQRAPSTDFNVANFTIGAWVWSTPLNISGMQIFANGRFGGGGTLEGYSLNYNTNLNKFFLTTTGPASNGSTGSITRSTWHHVAVTYDAVNVRFYIDGALDSTIPTGVLTTTGLSVGQCIGDEVYNSFVDQEWVGRLSGVFVNPTALSGPTIASIAATATPTAYKAAVIATSPLGLWMLDELFYPITPFKNPGIMTASSIEIQTTNPIAGNFGTVTLNEVIQLANPIAVTNLTAIGANTVINIPTGTTAITIVPPTNNVNALTLKGIAGDTGIAISKTQPTEFTIDPSQTTFVLNAGAATTVALTFF